MVSVAWYLRELMVDETTTRCPLLVHLTVPPLPVGTSAELLEMYESEMHDPTGIRISLPHPPSYWEGTGLGGVLVADQCGWAYGLEGGKGVKIEEFWSRSINCKLAFLRLWYKLLTDTRRGIRNRVPAVRPHTARTADGGDTYSLDFGQSLALVYCHHGHYRQLDLFRTRRRRDHVG